MNGMKLWIRVRMDILCFPFSVYPIDFASVCWAMNCRRKDTVIYCLGSSKEASYFRSQAACFCANSRARQVIGNIPDFAE